MRLKTGVLAGLCALAITGCTEHQSSDETAADLVLELKNSSDIAFSNEVVVMDLSTVGDAGSTIDWATAGLWIDSNYVESEVVDRNHDGTPDELLVLVSATPGSTSEIRVVNNTAVASSPKRTHAELSIKQGGDWKDRVYEGGTFVDIEELAVPPEHTDHSYFIRYEGPGWESEKVGYRFYLDWRNAVDIFGKTKSELTLDKVGLDGFDSYHEMADWGMDILKVGDALGVGALGCWSNGRALRISQTDSLHCAIPLDGNLESIVRTTYHGWSTPYGKTDVISDLSIKAGDRKTRHAISLQSSCDSLCTGIVKHPGTEVLQGTATDGWNYLATWGKQSLAEDDLGMAIFYKTSDLLAVDEDEFNHVVVLKRPASGELTYYLSACWQQEEDGITTKADFESYLKQTVAELDAPLSLKVAGV